MRPALARPDPVRHCAGTQKEVAHGIVIKELLLLLVASFPTLLAFAKRHPHRIGIWWVNVSGLFTFGLGWRVALIWCYLAPAKAAAFWDRYFRPASRP